MHQVDDGHETASICPFGFVGTESGCIAQLEASAGAVTASDTMRPSRAAIRANDVGPPLGPTCLAASPGRGLT
jgi:hypothetical protein